MTEFIAESNVHALVAFLLTALLLRRWPQVRPRERLLYWGWVLAGPLVLHPALRAIPFRRSDVFRRDWALFDLSRWKGVRFGPVTAWDLLVAGAVFCGLALLLRDVVPLLLERLEERSRVRHAPGPEIAELQSEVDAISRTLGAVPPVVELLLDPFPVLHCEGTRTGRLLISEGAIRLFDNGELRAALAHEVAHLKGSDIGSSWALLLLRTLLVFNPVVQLVARKCISELEMRADDEAARATDPVALASALLKLFRACGGGAGSLDLPGEGWLPGVFRRAESLAVRRRARRLVEGGPGPADTLPRLRFLLTGATIAALLVFVL